MTVLRSLSIVALLLFGCRQDATPSADPHPPTTNDASTTEAATEPSADASARANPPPATDGAADDPSADATSDGSPQLEGPNKGPPRNLEVLPKDWTRKQVTTYMKTINRGLGVKCKHCHNTADYAEDHKNKKVGRDMIAMQERINREYFAGEGKVTCFTCHNGELEIPK